MNPGRVWGLIQPEPDLDIRLHGQFIKRIFLGFVIV